MKIPVTAIIVAKNEEARLPECLAGLKAFAEIIVVDSGSRDKTAEVARQRGVRVVDFIWNGQYPKKRQWTLENTGIQTDWVLFVDADEIVTPALSAEIEALFAEPPACEGYFIEGRYRMGGKLLNFGIKNRKIVLFNRHAFAFPVIDDLDIPGMGEIEGHYQPLPVNAGARIGALKAFMIHDALDDARAWAFRHEKYARWEAGMNRKATWPQDPVPWRQKAKVTLRQTRLRPELMYLVSYIGKAGFLDGKRGLDFAKSRYRYYDMIRKLDAA
jgi:glycosyltransferase involved in cell wall biosynthesis